MSNDDPPEPTPTEARLAELQDAIQALKLASRRLTFRERLAIEIVENAPIIAVIVVAICGKDSLLPALAQWISKASPDKFIEAAISWPMFGLVLFATIGPRWIRLYLESIDGFGDYMQRRESRNDDDDEPPSRKSKRK